MVTAKTEREIMTLCQQLIDKGMQQGVQRGMLKGKYAVAKDMFADHLPLDTIHKYTKLSVQELKQLQAEFEAKH